MTEPGSEGATTEPTAIDPPERTDPADIRAADAPVPATAGAAFAHASEAEMARILDFYAVAWEYEPHRFPILWNLEGAVVESFSPDFYLPDLDLYLEMTTLRQRLVRKKNRKLRRLRELYPDVRIKLFYARDFRALMLKYGKLALVDALSGTPGQVGLVRADVALAVVEQLPEDPTALAELTLAPSTADAPAAAPSVVAQSEPVTASATARRRREEGSRRPARMPARPERPGSGR